MFEQVTGVVHGRSIELDRETGLPDGAAVTVRIEATGCRWRSAGGGCTPCAGRGAGTILWMPFFPNSPASGSRGARAGST